MKYPKFFDNVKSIRLRDKLSMVLGAFDDGIYEISYLEVVKSAGHSCPTVMGAYLLCSKGLAELYKDFIPVRGEVKVEFKESLEEGVAGVIANTITQITGATSKSGFKGLNGNFARHSLMSFNADISSSVRFTRLDTNESVDLFYDPSSIKPDTNMQPLMQKILTNSANADELKEFGELWQDRVKRIYENKNNVVRVLKV